MYAAAAGQVDCELYLLGKAVDKAVDPMAQDDEEVCEKLEAYGLQCSENGTNFDPSVSPYQRWDEVLNKP